ncbi:4-hydroxy-3-polyprenylbenzoate decarboxylase [Sphingomonas zeicaulis]|uniref:UbiX family flavin prenyltransferase n=1 Tax=Sphingomonas zeicaulis TaxID=1632740 RepID=UPI003D1DAE1E
MAAPRRIIVGITGATGIAYGIEVLRLLRVAGDYESHLIMSPAAIRTLGEESDVPLAEVQALADVRHSFKDIGASIASGSFRTAGMIIAPCSAHTMSAIAASLGDNLILRAADVCLKERRPLLLMLRETPLHLGHIEHMAAVTRYGAIVMPPVPGFYTRPASIAELVRQTAARALDVMGIDTGAVDRWGEDE